LIPVAGGALQCQGSIFREHIKQKSIYLFIYFIKIL